MSDDFQGFPQEGLDFLRELGTEDKTWFDEHRKTYESTVVAPTKAFVAALGAKLNNDLGPAIVAEPKTNGSIAPINNDLRFSPDKSPYKDHLLLRFWEGPNKKTAPTLFVRIGPDEIGFATGAAIADIERWRRLIDDDLSGAPLAAALAELGERPGFDIAGEGYKKVPKPYPQDHPRADLLRIKGGIQARWPEPVPAAITGPRFVAHCAKRLDACGDVHRWLVTNL